MDKQTKALKNAKAIFDKLDAGILIIGEDVGNHQMPLEMLLGTLKVYVYEGLGEDIPDPFKSSAYLAKYQSDEQEFQN